MFFKGGKRNKLQLMLLYKNVCSLVLSYNSCPSSDLICWKREIYNHNYSIHENVISAQNGYGGQRGQWLIQFLKSREWKCYINTFNLGLEGEARVVSVLLWGNIWSKPQRPVITDNGEQLGIVELCTVENLCVRRRGKDVIT